MIMGNLAGSKELQNLMKQYPNQNFPVQIPEYNKSGYNFIKMRQKVDTILIKCNKKWTPESYYYKFPKF